MTREAEQERPPSTEAANLMLDSMEFQDDAEYELTRATVLAIEEQARAEGRQQAVRAIEAMQVSTSARRIPADDWISVPVVLAILNGTHPVVAGLNASESPAAAPYVSDSYMGGMNDMQPVARIEDASESPPTWQDGFADGWNAAGGEPWDASEPHRHERDDHIGGYCLLGDASESPPPTADEVWSRLESEPGFNEEMRQAERDIAEGRGTPFREVVGDASESPPPEYGWHNDGDECIGPHCINMEHDDERDASESGQPPDADHDPQKDARAREDAG